MFETQGKIPKELILLSRPPVKIKDLSGKEITVIPGYVADASSTNAIKTATKWAGPNGTKTTKTNDHFTGLKIVGLETRGNGGRAYKVVDDNNNLFDFREDVLLDVIAASGIKKGGKLNGKYMWAQYGTSMRIVKVGSELHKALERATRRASYSIIDKNSLKPGAIYITKSGKKSIFIGHVQTKEMGFHDSIDSLKHKKYVKLMLCLNDRSWIKDTIENQFEKAMKEHTLYAFSFTKNSNFVEQIGKVSLPKDTIGKLRRAALLQVAKESNNKGSLSSKAPFAHMHEAESELPKTPEYVKFLTLA